MSSPSQSPVDYSSITECPKIMINATVNALNMTEDKMMLICRIILIVLFTTNIIGNLSVLYVMWGTGRKKRMRFFILNLAITDIFVATGAILPELILYIVKHFYAPEFMCRMVKYMQGTSIYASSFALILLSFDRAEVVINPMRSTKRVCFGAMHRRTLVICSWAAAGIFGLPSPILAQIANQTCVYDFSRVTPEAYIVSVSVTAFFLPALFIAACHVIMVVRIWQAGVTADKDLIVRVGKPASSTKFRRVVTHIFHDSQTQQTNIDSETKAISQSTNFIQLSSSPGCIPRARIKTVKMTLVIVSVYIICCCPFVIYNILTTYKIIGRHTPKLYAISPLIQPLASINSSVNPVIFWIFSAHTIITERRKNRRSKVVQRQHRRWKYKGRNRVWQGREERSEEAIILKSRRSECQYANNQDKILNKDKKEDVKVIRVGNISVSEVMAASPSSDSLILKKSGENSCFDKEEVTPIQNHSDFEKEN